MHTGDQRLRILQVMNRLDDSEVARYVLSVSNEMDRARFAVGIAAMAGEARYPAGVVPPAPDVAIHPIRLRRGEALGLRRLLLDWPNTGRLRRILETGGYHVVHTYQPGSAVWAWRAARGLGVPVIHTFTPGGWALSRSERRLFEHARIRRWSGAAEVRHFVAVSDYVFNWLRKTVGQPKQAITRSWLAVDLEALQPTPPNPALAARLQVAGNLVLALVGPLSAARAALAVEIIAELRRGVPQTTLLVTDPGPQRALLEHAARAAGQHQRLVIADPATPIAALLNLATLALSIDPGPNLSAPLLRALALAKPLVIITANPAELDMARMLIQRGLNGWALPPDPRVIAATLGGVLPLTGLLARMGTASRQIAERDFDIRHHTRLIETAYERVASSE